MLRGVRNRLGRRRQRRAYPVTEEQEAAQEPSANTPRVAEPGRSLLHSPSPGGAAAAAHRLDSATPPVSEPVVSTGDSPTKQPRVFRNRSLDAHRSNVGPRLRRILPGKALRPFHRSSRPPSSPADGTTDSAQGEEGSTAPRDRPLLPAAQPDKAAPAPGDGIPRNDDSFSSLPSTHASRDPFLNDDVPVDIARVEGREDRPRKDAPRRGEADAEQAFPRNTGASGVAGLLPFDLARSTGDAHSPPASLSSSSTFRKRSSLWKRTYDPDNEFQSSHERQILKAVSLSETAVKERSVSSAQQLAHIVNLQVMELDAAVAEVDEKVENARTVARELPSSRDARFEALLYSTRNLTSAADGQAGKAEAERDFRELQWTERVWDVEAMVAEKRYDDCVASIEKLEEDGIMKSALPRTQAKYQNIKQQLVAEMSTCCTQRGGETAGIFAPLLARVGMADHARNVVLDAAEAELMNELQALTTLGTEVAPRTIGAILDKTLAIFKTTHLVYSKISSPSLGSQSSSFFVAWVVEQSDGVYKKFVSPMLAKMRRADPVTILATIEAARHRKGLHRVPSQNEESLVALLETRITTHIRADLDAPIRDAERQLIDRARMYASAIPRNWREGPYQSGKAICDELNVLSKSLEGALMNLGTDTDILSGNLLIRLAMEYSATLLEMGAKAVSEESSLSMSAMQEGVLETFSMISRTIMRLHQRYPRLPSLERAAVVLSSSNLGEVRILLSEISSRRAPSPSVRGSPRFVREGASRTNHLLYPPRHDALIVKGRQFGAETPT